MLDCVIWFVVCVLAAGEFVFGGYLLILVCINSVVLHCSLVYES